MAGAEFYAYAHHGLIDPQAGVDADDEQVDGVGNAATDFLAATLDQASENHSRVPGSKAHRASSSRKSYGLG